MKQPPAIEKCGPECQFYVRTSPDVDGICRGKDYSIILIRRGGPFPSFCPLPDVPPAPSSVGLMTAAKEMRKVIEDTIYTEDWDAPGNDDLARWDAALRSAPAPSVEREKMLAWFEIAGKCVGIVSGEWRQSDTEMFDAICALINTAPSAELQEASVWFGKVLDAASRVESAEKEGEK
jgi:hypothetical protein